MVLDLDGLFPVAGNPTDEYASVRALVRQWAEKEIISKRLDYLHGYPALFTEKLDKLSIAMGLQKLAVAEEKGGFGWNTFSHAPHLLGAVTEASRADASAGVVLAMNYAVLSTFGASPGGSVPGCLTGLALSDRFGVISLILPGAGFAGRETPLFKGRSLRARIESDGDEASLSGENLRPVACGALASLYCVVCSDPDGLPVIALVPADSAGVSRGATIKTAGLNACLNADVTLSGVRIPRENALTETDGVEDLHAWISLLFGGASLGAGLNFFEILSGWCETRVIKGFNLLKENPLCATVLADVAEELACTRFLLHDLALLMASGQASGNATRRYTYAGMIGARAQQSVMKAVNRGLELMGSAGYAKEWHAEKHWRDVKTIQSILCAVGAEAPAKLDTARFFYQCSTL